MRVILLATLAGSLLSPGETGGGVPLSIHAEVGGKRYHASGTGECVTEPDGTIYDVPAEQWATRFSGDGPLRHLNLTLWRLKDGSGTQVTLWLQMGDTIHKISTVTGRGERAGRATAALRRSGAGGSLVVDGSAADGTATRITAECGRFEQNTDDNG